MEKEIETILKNKYKKLIIRCKYITMRKYKLYINIRYRNTLYESSIEFNYNGYLTLYENCDKLSKIIDDIIISFYKEGE